MGHHSAQAFLPILILAIACCGVAACHARAGDATPAADATTPLADPSLLLVRDDAVRQELKVTPSQREQLDALLSAHNRLLIAIRDVGPNGADDTAQPAIAELRSVLKQLFTTEQKLRLQGLILQAQGYDALLRKDIIAKLKISPEQQTTLAAKVHTETPFEAPTP